MTIDNYDLIADLTSKLTDEQRVKLSAILALDPENGPLDVAYVLADRAGCGKAASGTAEDDLWHEVLRARHERRNKRLAALDSQFHNAPDRHTTAPLPNLLAHRVQVGASAVADQVAAIMDELADRAGCAAIMDDAPTEPLADEEIETVETYRRKLGGDLCSCGRGRAIIPKFGHRPGKLCPEDDATQTLDEVLAESAPDHKVL